MTLLSRRTLTLVSILGSLSLLVLLAGVAAAEVDLPGRSASSIAGVSTLAQDTLSSLATTWVVTTTADSGPGTLRQAMLDAASGDTIIFDSTAFPSGSPTTIVLASALPPISVGNLTIDGSNAPIALLGNGLANGNGLHIVSDGNVVKGLGIILFPEDGIVISDGANNTIGGSNATPDVECSGDCNLISGNQGNGVRIEGSGSISNTVSGSFIGLAADGTTALGNGGYGVAVYSGAQTNTIGGASPGERNVISANDAAGVRIDHAGTSGNLVAGNYIGTDISGATSMGNAHSGVGIAGGATENQIGGATSGEGNVISGNNRAGIHIRARETMSNTVVGNFIGTDADGTGAVPNAGFGIMITEASYNVVGGSSEVERNIITYNLSGGVWLMYDGCFQNVIKGNWIGVDADGTRDVAVAHIAYSPAYATDQTVFAGTDAQGVFKTTDGGAHWSEMNAGLDDLAILALAVSPGYATDRTLFVGTPTGVYKSADGGTSWAGAGPGEQGEHVYDLALSPGYATDQTLLVGSAWLWSNELGYFVGGVWKSSDGGTTWENLAPAAGLSLSERRLTAASLYGDQLLGGDSVRPDMPSEAAEAQRGLPLWRGEREDGQPMQDGGYVDGYAVAFSPGFATDQTLFVGTRGSNRSLFKSSDGGASWTVIDSGLDPTGIRHIAVSPGYATDQTLYVMSTDQDGARPFRSTDGGVSWTELTTGLPADDSQPLGLALSPGFATDDSLFASFGFGTWSVRGFFRSSDRGDTWVDASPGIQNQTSVGVIAVSPDYASDGELLLSARWNGLLASYDEGDNWAYANGDLTDPGNGGAGISVMNWTNENFIGGEAPGEGNLISNNGAEGIVVQGPNNVTEIRGNYIGTDASGTSSLGNALTGVKIRGGSSENSVGGYSAPLPSDCTGPCNLISGNGDDGILVENPGGVYNTIRGNFVGTDATGSYAIPNLGEGVSLLSESSDLDIRNNLVSGNADSGILLSGGSSSITITGNYVGLDASGTFSIPNDYCGVLLTEGPSHNTIGGSTAGERNVISGNAFFGIALWFSHSMSNTISGNYVGTDASGTSTIPNGYYGINVESGYNSIGGQNASPGGTCSGECNLVSGNPYGIMVVGAGAVSNTVTGNYVGTDVNGTSVLMPPDGEYGNGVFVGWDAAHNRLGGVTPAERNVIAGMIDIGPDFGAPLHTQVSGNYIGLDATGTACLARSFNGISLGGQHSIIGGDTAAEGNRICGAEHRGISIYNSENLVSRNEIYGHGEDGIRVSGGAAISNTLTRNSIYDNGGLGIHLVDGGNTELPAPIILEYDLTAGTAGGTACANCTIELFSDQHGEGRWFEASTTAGAGGSWSIAKGSPFTGPYVRATATDAQGNTSEFSRALHDVAVVGATPVGTVQVGQEVSVTAELLNQGSDSEDDVPVRCVIADPASATVYSRTQQSGAIPAATFYVLAFSPWIPSAAGTHLLSCQSMLPGDENPTNDIYTHVLTVTLVGAPDVWTKDNDEDTGEVPSGHPWWVSPDIWVRHQPDFGLVHQNPMVGVANTVYVRLRNRGEQAASGEVGVYWDRSRMGWPCNVDQRNVGTIPFDDLAPGEARIVSLPWVPQEPGHHGLQTVIEADGDPAGWSAPCSPHRPRWDNNVSWHNVIAYYHAETTLQETLAVEEAVVDLVNIYDLPKDVDVIVERETFPATGTITLQLAKDLFDRWLAYEGRWSDGVAVLTGTNEFTITGAVSATIGGLPMEAGEEVTGTLVFEGYNEGEFEVALHERIDGLVVGGVTYQWLFDDEEPPDVTSTSPPDGAGDVAEDASIIIIFTEPIGPLSFGLTLTPALGVWTEVWNEAGTAITVTHSGFAPATVYTATVSASDAFANPMVPPYTWSFTTRGGGFIYLPLVMRNR